MAGVCSFSLSGVAVVCLCVSVECLLGVAAVCQLSLLGVAVVCQLSLLGVAVVCQLSLLGVAVVCQFRVWVGCLAVAAVCLWVSVSMALT